MKTRTRSRFHTFLRMQEVTTVTVSISLTFATAGEKPLAARQNQGLAVTELPYLRITKRHMKLVIRAFMMRHLAVDGVVDDHLFPLLEDLFFRTLPAMRIFYSTGLRLIVHRSPST